MSVLDPLPPVRTPPFTPPRPRPKSAGYSFVEIGEGAMGAASAVAVGASMFPGFLLTVPGLVLFLLPVIAIGLLAALAGLVVMLAVLPLVVGARVARFAWHARPALRAPQMPAMPRRRRAAARRPAL